MLYQLSYARDDPECSEGRTASQDCPAPVYRFLRESNGGSCSTLLPPPAGPYGEMTSYLYPVTLWVETNSPWKIWNCSAAGA